MRKPIYPKKKFAFVRKGENTPILALYLGSCDSLDNYKEITEEEYEAIIKANEEAEGGLDYEH